MEGWQQASRNSKWNHNLFWESVEKPKYYWRNVVRQTLLQHPRSTVVWVKLQRTTTNPFSTAVTQQFIKRVATSNIQIHFGNQQGISWRQCYHHHLVALWYWKQHKPILLQDIYSTCRVVRHSLGHQIGTSKTIRFHTQLIKLICSWRVCSVLKSDEHKSERGIRKRNH